MSKPFQILFFRWVCVYPAYINSNKTKQEGRLLPKTKCVPNPSYMEIRDVLMAEGYQPIVENKQYPRERSRELEFRGRIRVQLRNDDGSAFKDKFPTSKWTLNKTVITTTMVLIDILFCRGLNSGAFRRNDSQAEIETIQTRTRESVWQPRWWWRRWKEKEQEEIEILNSNSLRLFAMLKCISSSDFLKCQFVRLVFDSGLLDFFTLIDHQQPTRGLTLVNHVAKVDKVLVAELGRSLDLTRG